MPIPRVNPPQSTFERNSQAVNEWLIAGSPELREHQRQALLALKECLDPAFRAARIAQGVSICPQNAVDTSNGNRWALLWMATGTGKTGVGILAPFVLGSKKVLLISPTPALASQFAKEAVGTSTNARKSFLIKRNILESPADLPRTFLHASNQTRGGAGFNGAELVASNVQKWTFLSPVVPPVVPDASTSSASASSASASASSVPDPVSLPANTYDLIIVDEAHHHPSSSWNRLVNHFSEAKVIFLTATPFRDRGDEGRVAHIAPCYTLSRATAIERGLLRPLEFIRYRSIEDLPGAITQKLQQHDGLPDQPAESCPHKAMILTLRTGDAERISGLMPDSETFVGNSPMAIKERFDSSRPTPKILVVCQRLIEGYDNPRVSVVAICRPNLGSRIMFEQFVGRALRHPQGDTATAAVFAPQAVLDLFRANYEQEVQADREPVPEPDELLQTEEED